MTRGVPSTKAGGANSRTYKSWYSMKNRCSNTNAHNYRYYGGRGITVCERWKSYESFLEDMGERPFYTSLGRINNSGSYSKENCRWELQEEQNRNKSLYKKNRSGIAGVTWNPVRSCWTVKGDSKYIWSSRDFFEACCRRKAWERDQGRNQCK